MIRSRIARFWSALAAAARRIGGVPDYEAYVAHLKARHPDRAIPSHSAFLAERLRARYAGGGGHCC